MPIVDTIFALCFLHLDGSLILFLSPRKSWSTAQPQKCSYPPEKYLRTTEKKKNRKWDFSNPCLFYFSFGNCFYSLLYFHFQKITVRAESRHSVNLPNVRTCASGRRIPFSATQRTKFSTAFFWTLTVIPTHVSSSASAKAWLCAVCWRHRAGWT